jgi:hypothetical protein
VGAVRRTGSICCGLRGLRRASGRSRGWSAFADHDVTRTMERSSASAGDDVGGAMEWSSAFAGDDVGGTMERSSAFADHDN